MKKLPRCAEHLAVVRAVWSVNPPDLPQGNLFYRFVDQDSNGWVRVEMLVRHDLGEPWEVSFEVVDQGWRTIDHLVSVWEDESAGGEFFEWRRRRDARRREEQELDEDPA